MHRTRQRHHPDRHLATWLPGFLPDAGVHLAAGPGTAEDPGPAWAHHYQAVEELLDAPEADRDVPHPRIGTLPLAVAIDRFYTTDAFLHTWDLARATGQDDRLDPRECEALLAGMEPMDQILRDSGQYGPRVAVADDVPVQDRLIGFIGRGPTRQPPK